MDYRLSTVLTKHAIASLIDMASHAPAGAFAEVGVFKGGSAWFLYQIAESEGRALHLFDTFTGMPHADAIDIHKVGDMDGGDPVAISEALPRAQIHIGLFPGTLPDTLTDIAFVHVDCDMWASIRACIDTLMPRMVPGGIMLFDDYEYFEGARVAVDESEHDVRINRWGKRYFRK